MLFFLPLTLHCKSDETEFVTVRKRGEKKRRREEERRETFERSRSLSPSPEIKRQASCAYSLKKDVKQRVGLWKQLENHKEEGERRGGSYRYTAQP
jgi:hypothetical protein